MDCDHRRGGAVQPGDRRARPSRTRSADGGRVQPKTRSMESGPDDPERRSSTRPVHPTAGRTVGFGLRHPGRGDVLRWQDRRTADRLGRATPGPAMPPPYRSSVPRCCRTPGNPRSSWTTRWSRARTTPTVTSRCPRAATIPVVPSPPWRRDDRRDEAASLLDAVLLGDTPTEIDTRDEPVPDQPVADEGHRGRRGAPPSVDRTGGAAASPRSSRISRPRPPRPKPVRRKRASVPSWDEIMFGGPKEK